MAQYEDGGTSASASAHGGKTGGGEGGGTNEGETRSEGLKVRVEALQDMVGGRDRMCLVTRGRRKEKKTGRCMRHTKASRPTVKQNQQKKGAKAKRKRQGRQIGFMFLPVAGTQIEPLALVRVKSAPPRLNDGGADCPATYAAETSSTSTQ